jgi:hypothetical protein
MYSDNISGRREKRLPTMVAVRLAPLESVSAQAQEKTYTDNVSEHGVRVISTRPWRIGEQAEIAPLREETPVRGEVVYCQKLDNDRFYVGLQVPQSRIPWSVLRRFNGA